MNRMLKVLMFLMIFTVALNALSAQNGRPGRVIIDPQDVVMEIGETVQFSAWMEKDGARIDTTISWSLSKSTMGILSEDGLFTATDYGSVQVVASVGKRSGKAHVLVPRDSTSEGDELIVQVTPRDTALIIGGEIQYEARLFDSTGVEIDTLFTWSVSDTGIATIDSAGLTLALAKGHTFIYASAGNLQGKASLTVLRDSTEWKNKKRGFKVEVTPRDTSLIIGQDVQFMAALVDTNGQVIDTTFTWSLDDVDMGEITGDGLFTAQARGNGFVWATVGDLSGKAHVNVRVEGPAESDTSTCLMIIPQDTLVIIGSAFQYRAVLVDSLGNMTDTTATWALRGRNVGEMTADGYFTSQYRGMGLVQAKIRGYTATTKVIVASAADTAAADSVKYRFKHRDGEQIGNIKRTAEKEILKISGLPFPMNVLNGGELIFTPGTLSEAITIDISISESAFIEGDSTVSFADQILNGISFHVFVNDTLVSPYWFDEPVELVLPFKEELMQDLGLTVNDLGLFFYDETGFDSTGVTQVFVDTVENKIYAQIAHFSDIVIASNDCACSPVSHGELTPSKFMLYENYPNPFNPETVIRFDLSGGAMQNVSLTIYNLLGQEVRNLVQEMRGPGSYTVKWDGRSNRGTKMGSGVYIYRLKAGTNIQSRRMILLQ